MAKRRILLLALAAALLLAALGLWTHHAVREATYDTLSEHLQTILEADITALEIWIANEKAAVQSWVEQPRFGELTAALVHIANTNPDPGQALLASPRLSELQGILEAASNTDDLGFAVIDRAGLILASLPNEVVGLRLSPTGMALITRVFEDQMAISKPYRIEELFAGNEARSGRPIMTVAAPIHAKNGQVIAALARRIRPEQDFSHILSVARLGMSGDTYAFDANGVMLSASRHIEQLKAIGLLSEASEAGSILQVEIRDPGGDMTRGYKPKTLLAARPFTQPVAAAISGEPGTHVLIEPYRDYRGVRVIGAYRWLPDHGFGVATEVSVEEALAPLRPVRLGFAALFIVVTIATVGVLLSSYVVQRLRRRIGEVQRLGQYTLEKKIGEGGMGKVYLARHAMLRRPTAIKLIKATEASEETIARFEREVQLTSQLTHPNTVEIYDYGRTPEGIFYYAMEYLPGVSLASLIEMEGAITPARVVHILRQVCASLEEAHDTGLVHRDIKPLNIILGERGGQADFVKVLDFGLVKDLRSPEGTDMTAMHEVPGTPTYIAPERLKNPLSIDARCDLYSVGAVGFNLLTGQPVFTGSSAMEIVYHAINTSPTRPSEWVDHLIPPKLDQLIVDCLAKDPDDRPQNAGDIIRILDAITDAGRWEQEDARRWWKQHAARTQALQEATSARPPGSTPSTRTLAVDFRNK